MLTHISAVSCYPTWSNTGPYTCQIELVLLQPWELTSIQQVCNPGAYGDLSWLLPMLHTHTWQTPMG